MNTLTMVSRRAALLAAKSTRCATRVSRVAAQAMSTKTPFAVESPEGPADLEKMDNLDWDEQVVDYEMMFGHNKKIKQDRELAAKMMKQQPFAVESPDGPSDLELKDNLDWDEQVVDYEMMFGHNKKIKQDREAALKMKLESPFAVESPEGPADLELQDNLDWDDQVVDYEMMFGHAKEIKQDREAAVKIVAVDAPDGTTDSEIIDTLEWDAQVVDHEVQSGFAAELKEGRESARKILAVDAPDGTTDAEVLGVKQWDEEVIDSAAENEDAAEIHRQHKFQYEIRQQAARDAEQAW